MSHFIDDPESFWDQANWNPKSAADEKWAKSISIPLKKSNTPQWEMFDSGNLAVWIFFTLHSSGFVTPIILRLESWRRLIYNSV